MSLNRLVFSGKLAAGGAFCLYMYSGDLPPESESVEYSVIPAIYPGISAGYSFNNKMRISLFCDWAMIFFNTYPFTALNTGLALNISL